MNDKKVSVSVRMPAELYNALKLLSIAENRSLSGQIVHALGEWLEDRVEEERRENGIGEEGQLGYYDKDGIFQIINSSTNHPNLDGNVWADLYSKNPWLRPDYSYSPSASPSASPSPAPRSGGQSLTSILQENTIYNRYVRKGGEDA
jgi:hypothetical protein